MVAVSIAGIVVLGSSSLMSTSGSINARTEKFFWLDVRRFQIQGLLRSTSGWNSIVTPAGSSSLNPGLDCYLKGISCTAYTSPQNLKVPIDNIVLDGSNSSQGLDNKGNFCSSFDAVNGNQNCPIGISLKWQILCDTSDCLHGQPKITVQFQYKASAADSQALTSYNLTIYKDAELETLNEVCSAMGGTLVGMSCTLPQLSAACSPSTGSFALGFDASGTVICGRPNPGTCATSEAATGFNTNGGIECAPACP